MILTASSTGNLNFLDMIVLLVIGISIFIGYKRGLIKTLYSLCSVFIALIISKGLYPHVGKLLRFNGGPYDTIKANIVKTMNLNDLVTNKAYESATDIINSLPLPNSIIEKLIEQNTPEMYAALGVNNIESFIAGYFANIFINIIAMVLVFVIVMIAMRVITASLNIICKLPVIRTFNSAGGLLAGLVAGTVYVWIGLTIYTLFFVNPSNNAMANLQSSLIAIKFYENNLIFDLFLKIFLV